MIGRIAALVLSVYAPLSLTNMRTSFQQSITVIVVGLMGCLLTSMAGIAAVMASYGWVASGGWREWLHRLSIAYPAASTVVLLVFPWLVPCLSRFIDGRLRKALSRQG